MQQLDKTRQFETKSIGLLLLIYSIPPLVSQLVTFVYNFVDKFFLGQVSSHVLAGTSYATNVMGFINAFSLLVAVGAAVCMSIALGKKNHKEAQSILGNSMLLSVIIGFLFILIGYLFMDKILRWAYGSGEAVSYASSYLKIVLPGLFMTILATNLTGLMRSLGYPFKSMLIMVGGIVLNIILDIVFVPVLGWGIIGAAWATSISMTFSAVLAVLLFLPKDAFISLLKPETWQLKWSTIGHILYIGLAPFLLNVVGWIGGAFFMRQLSGNYGYGVSSIGAYSIVNIIISFGIMLFPCLCQGMQPIAGYNFGAGRHDRLKSVFGLTTKINVIIGLVGVLLALTIPRILLRVYINDPQLVEMSVPVMRIMGITLPLVAFVTTSTCFFQSIGKAWVSIAISISHKLLFLIPLVYFIPSLFVNCGMDGLTGLWASRPISDVLGAVLALVLILSQRKVFKTNKITESLEP